MKLLQAYACNIYGSNVWDLFSPECNRIYTSFNVAVRSIFKLPRMTHKYLLEPLLSFPHLHVQLISRYVTFSKTLLSNKAFEVRFLARASVSDMRTVLGKSMTKITDLCNLEDFALVSAKVVKDCLSYQKIPENELWRLGILEDMLNVLQNNNTVDVLTYDEAMTILNYVCVT